MIYKILSINRFLILILSVLYFSCQDNKVENTHSTAFIPTDAALIIEFKDFLSWQKKIESQNFISNQNANPLLKFWSLDAWRTFMQMPNDFILTYNQLGKSNLTETIIFEKQDKINLNVKSKQTYQYDQINIQTFEIDKQFFYLADLGQNTIISRSKIILENIIRNHNAGIKTTEAVNKILNVLSDNTPSLVINANLFGGVSKTFFKSEFPETLFGLSNYIGFDLNISDKKILLSGIAFPSENQKTNWSKFKNVKAENSVVAEVIPSNFVRATSLLISDYEKFTAIKNNVNQKPVKDSIWLNIKELAHVELNSGDIKAMVSKDIDQTFQALETQSIVFKDFGGTQIYEYKNAFKIKNDLSHYITSQNLKYFAVFHDVIISSDQLKTLEDNIIQINNQKVLSNQVNYKNHMASLSDESHILWFTKLNNQNAFFKNQSQEDYLKAFDNLNWDDNDLLVSQLIVEDNYAYFNILQHQTPDNKNKTQVEQIVRLKAKTNPQNHPQFFKNWRTGQLDVVYQDTNNILHLKDTKGNLIWSKPLESPIVGKISTIDIYQNTRLQLAFATQNKIYILDKNGNHVAPFPLDFKNQITQSLSVFDYDNNGKYRFVVVMDDKIRMYDKKAKRVRGFKFRKTKTPVAYPVKHIRTQNKDYILVQENSGKLNILSRRGKTRIQLIENFSHKDSPWFEYQNQFVSISNEGALIKIDGNGNINRIDKNWINPKFDVKPNMLVSMSENQLQINTITEELPYGLYTNPIIIQDFIGLSDTQTQKTYLLNSKGKIIDGFPVYAKQITDIKSTQNDLLLLCQDQDEAIIVYRVNFN